MVLQCWKSVCRRKFVWMGHAAVARTTIAMTACYFVSWCVDWDIPTQMSDVSCRCNPIYWISGGIEYLHHNNCTSHSTLNKAPDRQWHLTCDGEKGSKRIGDVSGVSGRWYWRWVVVFPAEDSPLGSFLTQSWLLRECLWRRSDALSRLRSDFGIVAVARLIALSNRFISEMSLSSMLSRLVNGLVSTARHNTNPYYTKPANAMSLLLCEYNKCLKCFSSSFYTIVPKSPTGLVHSTGKV